MDRVALPTGPERDLRDAIYLLYVEADSPRLSDLATTIAEDNDLPGAPGRDLIRKIISGDGLGSQQDTVTVAVALAREAGRIDAAIVASRIRQLWLTAKSAPPPVPAESEPVESPARLGRPVSGCDPLMLEVHPAISILGAGLDPLPTYLPREHDALLRQAADRVVAGVSTLVTVVGGSSTGKTRACWELMHYVDQREPDRWWVWHPYDPTRPEAIAQALAGVGPYTVVWLNEAQHYLLLADVRLGERIAAGLRSLLHEQARGPVLVLATLWPQYWSTLTTRPAAGEPDPYAQARELLTGTAINMPDAFTAAELALLDTGVDPRVELAAAHAEAGRITQYLAGAPALEDRYRTAQPAARAIIRVAMDARRLGYPLALPHALLEQSAPGYLDDQDWDAVCEDWLEQALAYAATPCKGARGPLTRIRARPGGPHRQDGQPCYRLADYLEQVGRTERAGLVHQSVSGRL